MDFWQHLLPIRNSELIMGMELIEELTVSTDSSSVTLSAIPQTYTDLLLVSAAQTDRTGVNNIDSLYAQFNGVTTGYSGVNLVGFGNATTATASLTQFRVATANEFENSSVTFGNSSCLIANYTSAVAKSGSQDGVSEANTTIAGQQIAASLWNNTAAITSIELFPTSGTLIKANSVFWLYGIS